MNAANEGCITGGGVDGAVNRAGGDALFLARKALPIIPGTARVRCRTGDAKTTVAGELPCEWVIHAVGPNYALFEEAEADELLFRAYRAAMVEARRKALPTVGFSLLSAGIFRGAKPLRDVLAIGVLALDACAYRGLEEVFLVGFTEAEVATLTELLEALSADRAGATAAMLERLAPAVRQMHADARAGVTEDLPVGWSISWMAAAAAQDAAAAPLA